MDLNYLFDRLSEKDFQNYESGNLFFPAYIYTYPPEEEYSFREELTILKERLQRANIFQDSMIINIYDEFITYLKKETLGDDSLFDLIIKLEESDGFDEASNSIMDIINDRNFLDFIHNKIIEHFDLPSSLKKVYVFIHGFGSIYPFLRLSEFIKRFEEFIVGGGYKVIAFYPGKYENNHYYIFNEINNEDLYRAILLNK